MSSMPLWETEKRLAEDLRPKGKLWGQERYFGGRASNFRRFPAPFHPSDENNIKVKMLRMLRSRGKAWEMAKEEF
jgi:hypothetical protein